MRLSDIIEDFIKELFDEENEIEIQRNDLAEKFNCVPSQINYVISTRFKPGQGYVVESSRGGGGHITIKRISIDKENHLMHIIANLGDKMTANDIRVYLTNLYSNGLISEKEVRLIRSATSDNILKEIDYKVRDSLRADIFKNMLLNIYE